MTSRAVVNALEDRIPSVKVGHAGTLDPLATGVLILGIGQATRLLEYVQRMPKTYVATFLFGQSSDTDDIEGEVSLEFGNIKHVVWEWEFTGNRKNLY